MKNVLATLLAVTVCATAVGQSQKDSEPEVCHTILDLRVQARVDYERTWTEGAVVDDHTGFKGKYLFLRADGTILPGLDYSLRQRLNKKITSSGAFDATDWVYLQWTTGRWTLAGGKEVIYIGGFEYDRAPMDLYGVSLFWMNIPCFGFGVSGGYNITKNDVLTAQITQSPFYHEAGNNSYAYNLLWTGTHGLWSTRWSANMCEYAAGKYISYLALGNRFTAGPWQLELDLMNRAAAHQAFLFKDVSLMSELAFCPTDRWRMHLKYTYDNNHSGNDADLTVYDGTELSMLGGGVEFYPLRKCKYALRLHANYYYSWGRNTNTADIMQRNTSYAAVGLTWDMSLLNLKK
ncbi:MAG: OprO/OprP family phosphate-selective porin [Muribaculaceae bacterium]|nr:OprO/OprP family phosphate-selective porin [Muribaculaceae bacterium]